MPAPIVFISHSHSDKRLAERFHRLLDELSKNTLMVQRSSKEGEIATGQDWRGWIDENIRTCQIAIVLLTPASLRGRWVMWEAGAVAGVQYERNASEEDATAGRRVRVIRFGVSEYDLGPFGGGQTRDGLIANEVLNFLSEIITEFKDTLGEKTLSNALISLSERCNDFVRDAANDMRFSAVQADEPLIQAWLQRLEDKREDKDWSWIAASVRWINLAFLGAGNPLGQDKNGNEIPIDFRVHAMLAEAFDALGQYDQMAKQLELARQLSPNDLVILRLLGKAYRRKGGSDGIEKLQKLLAELVELDPSIFRYDREMIALKVGFYADSNSESKALELLNNADQEIVRNDPYLLNWLATILMKCGQAEQARERFVQLERLLLDRNGFWDLASKVNAYLALSKNDLAEECLRQLRDDPSWSENKGSASRYFDDIINVFNPEFDWRRIVQND